MLTDEDIDFIEEDLKKGKAMEPTYNKVQYSEFTPDRVGQWVLRGDTLQEVLDLKKELTDKLSVGKPIQAVHPNTPPPSPHNQVNVPYIPEDTYTVACKECGGPTTYREGVSKKTGKPWKGYFCNSNRDHQAYFVK